jgi:hypothetical protein
VKPAQWSAHAPDERVQQEGGEPRDKVFRCRSVSLAGIDFQACSFNHSDISPFRIKELRSRHR